MIQFKRGKEANRQSQPLSDGQPLFTLDQHKLYIGSGSVNGGIALTASLADTASLAVSASYVLTSSYSLTSDTSISSSYTSTASYSATSSFALNSGTTIATGGFVVTASGALTNSTASYSINTSTSSYSLTASYVLNSATITTGGFVVTASGALTNQTASYSLTASFIDNINTVNFDKNLFTTDNTTQLIFDRLDDHQHNTGPAFTASISHDTSGVVTITSTDVYLYQYPNWTGSIGRYSLPPTTFLIPENTITYLYADYNNGNPRYNTSSISTTINSSDKCFVATISQLELGHFHIFTVKPATATATRLNNKDTTLSRFDRVSGLGLTVKNSPILREIVIGSGTMYYGVDIITTPEVSSSMVTCSLWYHSASVWTHRDNLTQYDNLHYDTGINTASVSNNKYAVNWIYKLIDQGEMSGQCIGITLGSGDYTITEARNSQPQSPPDLLRLGAILVGRIIVEQNSSTITQIDSTFTTNYLTTPAADHNNLGGLQGGATNDYFHLTQTQHDGLIYSSQTSSMSVASSSYIEFNNVANKPALVSSSAQVKDFNGFSITASVISASSILASTVQGNGFNIDSVDFNKLVNTPSQLAYNIPTASLTDLLYYSNNYVNSDGIVGGAVVQAGFKLVSIIASSSANTIINLGTQSLSNTIVNTEVVRPTVDEIPLGKQFFSNTNSSSLYVSSPNWGGNSVNLICKYEKIAGNQISATAMAINVNAYIASGNFVMSNNDVALVQTTFSTSSIFLPTSYKNSQFIVKKITSDSNYIYIYPSGSQQIDNSNVLIITSYNNAATIIGEGNNYYVV